VTYSPRHIDLKIRLGQGSFGESGNNTASVSGLRCSAIISKAGGLGMNNLALRVFGLTKKIANQITVLGKPISNVVKNDISVSAGADDTGMSVTFIGTIFQAWQDLNQAPDASVTISAFTGLLEALRPLPPISFQGSADVATIMSGIAKQIGFDFENNGVSVQLANPYFPGTGRQQAAACAEAANINWLMDDQPGAKQVLAIWPKDGQRGGAIPLISPDTGMVGYPTWTENGIAVKTLYNPSIVTGGKIKVDSEITVAKGEWQVFSVTHELESETPDGKWFTTAECNVLGHQAIAR
jgi:hypothetical protein